MQISDSFTNQSSSISDARTQRKGQQVARIASLTVILVGCAVLVGWKLDLGWLKSFIPGAATMKVNTALCFVGAGISLRLLSHTRSSLKSRIINGCTIAIIIIALLTICQYVLGWNLGIDELLFSDSVTPATSHPGRMGVNTAVNFGLTGAALWLLNRQDRKLPRPQQRVRVDTIAIAQSLALIVGAIALQAVVGYAYNVQALYRFNTLTTSMALHTAVGFVVLAGGILALRSDRGWMRSLTADLMGGDIARRFIPTAIVLPLVVGWLILQGLNANLYDPNFALSLMSMSVVAISLGLIAKNAGIINGIDYDRIRSSDRMRSSEERLKLALQGARQGTWDFDLQTQELAWDDRCKEMFGLDPTAVVNYDSYLAAVYPDDRQRVADAAQIAIRDGGEFAQEYRTVHSDGTSHWILAQGRCFCAPAGEPCRMSGTMMEITERKQVQLNERFLSELTRRLRLISDADELQDEAARSVGEYLHVDRVTWFSVDWSKRLATVDRDWYRAGLESHVGVYAIADFLVPAMQVALFAGESVAIADVHAEPSLMPHLAAYQQLGLQAFANIPCFNENQWVATLHVNTERVRNWRNDEVALLQAVAAQIWPTIEQTRAVQALRAQEEQTRAAQATIRQQLIEIEAIYQAAPIGLCFVDTDLRYVRINERLAQINGASVAAHIGHTLRELLPELADDVEPIYRQVIESGEPIVDLEVSGTNPAQPGVWRSWISSFYPQIDAENRIIGVNTVVQEITERQRQEAALRSIERKFSDIFNQTFELMGIVSLDGVLLEVNQAALDSIAATESEIVGKQFWEAPWWHTEQLQQQLREAIAIAASGQFIRYEVAFPNPSGGVSITDFSLKPIFDDADRVTTLLAEARDITAQQTALHELNRSQAALKQRNQELDSFVYVVAHDLKAPLRAVANLSQWIEDDLEGSLSVANQQQMALLRSRVTRMGATIDGLIDYARIGCTDANIEPVSVPELLAETIDSIAPPPTFTITIAPDLPTLNTKRLCLAQVFANLISNAIKHHDRSDGSLQIFGRDLGDLYEFVIADDGPGIAPEQHDRIFEIFQAVNPQNRSDSTGIGLSIVKKIIETEGGTIRVESQIGTGTTFYFTWIQQS